MSVPLSLLHLAQLAGRGAAAADARTGAASPYWRRVALLQSISPPSCPPARCPPAGSKLARPLVIAGTVAAATAAYGNRDKHAAGPLAVAAAVNAAAVALTLLLIKPVEKEIEVGLIYME